MIQRRKTKTVSIGKVKIGSKFPVSIQSMAKTKTAQVHATVRQIRALEKCGCEIVRVAVQDTASARALDKIKKKINIPLVADIHFNYRLALEALARGVDCIRLNPGNIYRSEEVRQVAGAAKKRRVPIRVGVNSGSLRNTRVTDPMVKAALNYIKMLEGFGFDDIIVSLKASDVLTTVSAYRKIARRCNYPLHLGVTASGLPRQGTVNSVLGIGSLLLDGLGDTIRVSLTGNPEEEVAVARQILKTLELRRFGPQVISCPTCGRTKVDLVKIAQQFERQLSALRYPLNAKRGLKIAIMGCEVNGPGEAQEADLGVACGNNRAALFRKGKIVRIIKQDRIVKTLISEVKNALE
ncbi:flavodoxin-dependent (E)-4-hydroxy-3-methylbut-2-enyl-diphosphate synthase [Candidatus Omnitrophota bacterium]